MPVSRELKIPIRGLEQLFLEDHEEVAKFLTRIGGLSTLGPWTHDIIHSIYGLRYTLLSARINQYKEREITAGSSNDDALVAFEQSD